MRKSKDANEKSKIVDDDFDADAVEMVVGPRVKGSREDALQRWECAEWSRHR